MIEAGQARGRAVTYAVPDLHGADDLLDLALARIEANAAQASSRTVVFLGDYVDRGAGSRQIVERLMAGPPPGWTWICLKGNHEDMMAGTWDGAFDPDWWVSNGGDATLVSYGQASVDDVDMTVIPARHIAWVRALPAIHADRHRVFVHAGVDPAVPLEDHAEHDLLWMRQPFSVGHGERHVVHGHTPHVDGPLLQPGRTNLDTLAWRTGRLVIGVFDDAQAGGPVALIEVLRPLD